LPRKIKTGTGKGQGGSCWAKGHKKWEELSKGSLDGGHRFNVQVKSKWKSPGKTK